jgi:hypothetical protein
LAETASDYSLNILRIMVFLVQYLLVYFGLGALIHVGLINSIIYLFWVLYKLKKNAKNSGMSGNDL